MTGACGCARDVLCEMRERRDGERREARSEKRDEIRVIRYVGFFNRTAGFGFGVRVKVRVGVVGRHRCDMVSGRAVGAKG